MFSRTMLFDCASRYVIGFSMREVRAISCILTRTRTVCVKGTEVIAKKSYSAARLAFTESAAIPSPHREERERKRERDRERRMTLKPRTLLFTEMQIHGLKTKPFSNAHYLHCEGFVVREHATCFKRLTPYRGSLVVQFYKITDLGGVLSTFSVFMNGGLLPQIWPIFPENIGREKFHFFSLLVESPLSIVLQKFTRTFLTSLNRDNCLDILTGENTGRDERIPLKESSSYRNTLVCKTKGKLLCKTREVIYVYYVYAI